MWATGEAYFNELLGRGYQLHIFIFKEGSSRGGNSWHNITSLFFISKQIPPPNIHWSNQPKLRNVLITKPFRWPYHIARSRCFLSSLISTGCLMRCICDIFVIGCDSAGLLHWCVVCRYINCWISDEFWRGHRWGCRYLSINHCCGFIFPRIFPVSVGWFSRWSLHYVWFWFYAFLQDDCWGLFACTLIKYSNMLPD